MSGWVPSKHHALHEHNVRACTDAIEVSQVQIQPSGSYWTDVFCDRLNSAYRQATRNAPEPSNQPHPAVRPLQAA